MPVRVACKMPDTASNSTEKKDSPCEVSGGGMGGIPPAEPSEFDPDIFKQTPPNFILLYILLWK